MAHLPYPSGPRPARHKRRAARSRLTLGGGVAAAAVAIGVITASGGADTAQADSTTRRPASDVTITDAGLADRGASDTRAYLVHYEITNTGDRAADYVARLRFLDKDGGLLGSTDIDASRLPSGDTTKDTAAADLDRGTADDITTVEIGAVDRAEAR
ncbi:hypothetical protein [Streptomyces fractus]|uniref:hypothetical protein n=1 Tax=Streptomyces fractus TaxID=641806 RepID=UPI003CF0C451